MKIQSKSESKIYSKGETEIQSKSESKAPQKKAFPLIEIGTLGSAVGISGGKA